MQRLSFVFVLFIFMAILAVGQRSMAAEASPPPADPVKQIEQLLAAKEPYELVFGRNAGNYTGLFQAVGTDGRRRLLTHANDSIAIQAAWGEVAITVPEKEGDHAFRPDREKLNWFLGFLEGRARIQPPQWWTRSLLDCRANRRNNIYFVLPEKFSATDAVSTEFTDVIRVGEGSFRLPADLLKQLDTRDNCLSTFMTPTRCYVAVHDDVGYPFPLACIDRVSKKLLWKSKVWGTWWANATGQHRMCVTITEQSNRIVVFGVAATGLHVEAFRSDNGENLFRFSTSYAGY